MSVLMRAPLWTNGGTLQITGFPVPSFLPHALLSPSPELCLLDSVSAELPFPAPCLKPHPSQVIGPHCLHPVGVQCFLSLGSLHLSRPPHGGTESETQPTAEAARLSFLSHEPPLCKPVTRGLQGKQSTPSHVVLIMFYGGLVTSPPDTWKKPWGWGDRSLPKI